MAGLIYTEKEDKLAEERERKQDEEDKDYEFPQDEGDSDAWANDVEDEDLEEIIRDNHTRYGGTHHVSDNHDGPFTRGQERRRICLKRRDRIFGGNPDDPSDLSPISPSYSDKAPSMRTVEMGSPGAKSDISMRTSVTSESYPSSPTMQMKPLGSLPSLDQALGISSSRAQRGIAKTDKD